MHRRNHVHKAEAAKQHELVSMEIAALLQNLVDIKRFSHG
jgi:hypothetical protein